MTAQLLAFVATCLVVIVVPGPDFLLVLRNTVRAGRAGAAWTSAGILLGVFVLGTAAALGVTALLKSSSTVSTVVRVAGGVYLAWLGIQSLRSWLRLRREQSGGLARVEDTHRMKDVGTYRWSCFRQGLVTNLLNPKVVAFYLALFPQFTLDPLPPVTAHLVLAGGFWVLCLLWYILLVTFIGKLGTVLQRPTVVRRTEAVAGGALVGLGGIVLVPIS